MSLSSGTRLGPYEVVAPLGEGGMGAVYRATDTRLNRTVAIKAMHASGALDPDHVARFEREAQLLASLNHPNIAAIHGLEIVEDATYLVLEFVDGRPLSDVLREGALPVSEALPIARQIADALAATHERGIIHRDLKPGNVMVTPDGQVKVLDFGLGKAMDPGPGTQDSTNSPTMTMAATQAGIIMGTAGYMSPEQAKGRDADRRSDVWAFGCVLFEMLSGRRAFEGEDITETLAAIVRGEPEWTALPAATPPAIRGLIERCLVKKRADRLPDMSVVRFVLNEPAVLAPEAASASTPVARSRPRALVAAAVLGITAVGIAIGWMLPSGSAASIAPTRFLVSGSAENDATGPVLTPDGRVLIFMSGGRLYKRDLESFEAVPIPGTDGATTPMVSPDGRWIAFFANGQIKKVLLSGGDPTRIAEANASMPGAVWGPDDTIYFSRGWATGLSAVAAAGGEIRQLTEPNRADKERGHWRPHPLPGGERLVFTITMAGSGVNDARIGLLNLKTGQHRALFPGTDGVYLASGHILYFHAGAWHVVPFDAAAEKVTGEPTTVLADAPGVAPDGGNSRDTLTVADNGTVAYPSGPFYPTRELVWMDQAGRVESLGFPPRSLEDASLSPDGRQIAMSRVEAGTLELWMNDIERKTEDRLDIKGSNFDAIWSPDGDAIAFGSIRKGEYDAYRARPDGSNVEPILTKDFDEQVVAWLEDGRFIEKDWRPDGSTPVTVIDPGGGTSPQELVSGASNWPYRVSSNGRWLIYNSSATGTPQVYVKAMAGNGPAIRVSSGGGDDPIWSPGGDEIYFHHGQNQVAVSFRENGDRGSVGVERILFPLPSPSRVYGITPDGRRFLVGRLAEPEPAPGIRVVLNWFQELTALPRGR